MIDLIAGDMRLRRRLEAYADDRLTPDVATASRIRARVLAVAHRRAELARADAALTVVRTSGPAGVDAPRRRSASRRPATALLVATLSLGLAAGTALAARPGGALYEARLWAETVTLPRDPSARALAELDRLDSRLAEAADAIRAGDAPAAAAALLAYERIVEESSTAAVTAGDDVASAVLTTGVGRNVEKLQALVSGVPDQAADAIARAIERAIARSTGAIDAIGHGRDGSNGSPGGQPGAGPGGPDAKPPKPPSESTPTPKPTKATGAGEGGQSGPNGQPPGHDRPGTTQGKPSKSPKPPH